MQRDILFKALFADMWSDELVRIQYNYNEQVLKAEIKSLDDATLKSITADFGIYAKGAKGYLIDHHNTVNRWYNIYTVYEITDEGTKLFKGKFEALKVEDVLEEL